MLLGVPVGRAEKTQEDTSNYNDFIRAFLSGDVSGFEATALLFWEKASIGSRPVFRK